MEKSHRIKNVQECTDTSDCIELSRTSGLYLKPIARLSITVTLPQLKSGQSISNWEVMEKLRAAILPEVFTIIKVTKSTLEFLRFDGEIENRKHLAQVISKIDQKGIKLSGFSDLLKIRATEAKVPFPSRHDWDSFFRDAKHMNEMKPGERPDTVHFQDLPCHWFTHISDENRNVPSDYVLSKVMASFGEVRIVDIPITDPYRKKMSASINGIRTFTHGQDLVFAAYVQFKEYIGFAKCMHALQGKKLIYVDNDKAYSANIKVDFDRTKHLSEYSIKKRQAERDKLQAADRELEEKVRRKEELEELKLEAERIKIEDAKKIKEERKEAKRREKEARRKAREEKRRVNRMEKEEEKIRMELQEEEEKFTQKIKLEERKLLIAQRKLESIRLLDELFQRMKLDRQKKVAHQREAELFDHVNKESSRKLKEIKKSEVKERKIQEKLALKEKKLRNKLVSTYKSKEEDRMEQQREKVRKAVQGQVRIQSGISTRSLSSISSATSESGSDISSDTDSDSSSSLVKPVDPKLTLGRMRMDHMDEEEYSGMNWQNHPSQGHQPYPPFHDRYGYQEGHGFSEDWGYGEGFDKGRGRGRGRWRFPRGPWRGRGFRDRGRGFRDRGRGFRGSWHGGNFGYDDPKKPLEGHKPKTTWYKRGDNTGDDDSRSRSRSHSRARRSRSKSRSRSHSRSRRSRSKSRSRSRRRSYSRSRRSRSRRSHSRSRRSRSKRTRSRSKSRSRKSRSRSDSKSKRSRTRSRSRSKRSHSKSKSRSRSRSGSRKSHSKSRSRSRKRSRTHSRSRSRNKRRRHSSSDERSSYSGERRRDKHKSERQKDGSRTKSDEQVNYEDLRESDLELSSDPDDHFTYDYHPDEEFENEYMFKDFYSRGPGWRGHPNFMRGSRGRWPRIWRGRGRGWGYSSYPEYHEHDNWRQGEANSGDQYRDIYQKYFESLADRDQDVADKRKDDPNCIEAERTRVGYPDLKESEEYRPREGQSSLRTLPDDRNYPPEEPLRDRTLRIHDRLHDVRKSELEKNELGNLRDETDVRKRDYSRKFSQRELETQKTEIRRGYEAKENNRRAQSHDNERQEYTRPGSRNENGGYIQGHKGKDRIVDRYEASEERKCEKSLDYGEGDTGIDVRWKTQVMRADLERQKSDSKEVSVKDRLSFVPVKRERGVVTPPVKYERGYYADRKSMGKMQDNQFDLGNKDQKDLVRIKGRRDVERSRERQVERPIGPQMRRDEEPHREMREKLDVVLSDREKRNYLHKEGRERHDVGYSDRERRDGPYRGERERHDGGRSDKEIHAERSESKSRHAIERHNSPVSSESDSDSGDEKGDHSGSSRRRKEKQNYDSDRDSDDNDSQYKSHHRKRRKNGKKKRDERSSDGRKHKHKKKKKRKDGRKD